MALSLPTENDVVRALETYSLFVDLDYYFLFLFGGHAFLECREAPPPCQPNPRRRIGWKGRVESAFSFTVCISRRNQYVWY